jgi:hypothetical protein
VRRAAVALIAERMRLTLPGFESLANVSSSHGQLLSQPVIFEPSVIAAEQVEKFVNLGAVIAHAVITRGNRRLLVRIKTSARTESQRRATLLSFDVSSIEIDLHRLTLDQINDRDTFEAFVLHDPMNRSWIRSLRAERLQAIVERDLAYRAKTLEDTWAAQMAEQEAKTRAAEAGELARQALRARELEEHRRDQAERAKRQDSTVHDYGDESDPLLQRRYMIAETRLKAAREWGYRGVECSAFYLVSPPDARFCHYCASDSQMNDVAIPADIEKTIHHQMRSSIKPDRSLKSVPHLMIFPGN